jgi:hypothetical protein
VSRRDAEAVAVAALKGLHVALAGHGVTVQSSFHLLTRKGIDIFRGAQCEDNRFHSDHIAALSRT